jgi:hypothetical protein
METRPLRFTLILDSVGDGTVNAAATATGPLHFTQLWTILMGLSTSGKSVPGTSATKSMRKYRASYAHLLPHRRLSPGGDRVEPLPPVFKTGYRSSRSPPKARETVLLIPQRCILAVCIYALIVGNTTISWRGGRSRKSKRASQGREQCSLAAYVCALSPENTTISWRGGRSHDSERVSQAQEGVRLRPSCRKHHNHSWRRSLSRFIASLPSPTPEM